MAIARETTVEQSCIEFLRDQLFNVRDFPEEQIEILDRFPDSKLPQPLTKNYIAAGFHFDEGGVQAELGSSLKTRNYVLEFYVFALSAAWGGSLSSTLRDAVDVIGTIPLLDLSQPEKPEFDRLVVLTATSRNEPVEDPEPWEQFVYAVTVVVEDTYFASLM